MRIFRRCRLACHEAILAAKPGPEPKAEERRTVEEGEGGGQDEDRPRGPPSLRSSRGAEVSLR